MPSLSFIEGKTTYQRQFKSNLIYFQAAHEREAVQLRLMLEEIQLQEKFNPALA